MNIIDIGVMRGPSYWSVKNHQLIVMTLDLQQSVYQLANTRTDFTQKIAESFADLNTHTLSEAIVSDFLKSLPDNISLARLIGLIALEIQSQAGMHCNFITVSAHKEKEICDIVFAYQEEEAGVYAAKGAVRMVKTLLGREDYNVSADIEAIKKIAAQAFLGPSTNSIVEEAIKRNIPVYKLDNLPIIQFGHGIYQKRMRASISTNTSSIGVDIACNKEETKNLLDASAIPVPKGSVVSDEQNLQKAVTDLGYPLVIKPLNGNQGKGATINIKNWAQALEAFKLAQRISHEVIVEKYISGFDFRFLVINYKVVAVAKRTPACVKGDGSSTIQQLIDQVNKDPRRGCDHENVLTAIKVDESTRNILAEKNLSLSSVLKKGEILYLKRTANLSTGGTATDVTDQVHPDNIHMAERIARIVDLDICGIDVMAPEVITPITENGGAILEVNAAPGFRMHLSPTEGMPRNVAAPVIDMLFPKEKAVRIPIVAVTGTNGKTTTTRLIAHLARKSGCQVGFTTTDGIYIGDKLMVEGDCTGPASTAFVLKDPTVDFAVLECARGGILRSGLGFDQCDIGIVTNVSSDHLGMKGIYSLDQLAKVKSVIPQTVHKEGFAVLNADDDLVYDMAKDVDCRVVLFTIDQQNPRIKRHCEKGGLAAIVENGYITICEGKWKTRIEKVVNIPLTYSGKATFMVQNILPAVLTAFIRGFQIKEIRNGLQTFIPSLEQTPGRLNIFEFNNFKIMVDYAHNPGGIQAIGKFLKNENSSCNTGIITGMGDRRDEDIITLGKLSAQVFDEVIIRQDKDLRGRADMEIVDLLMKGIRESGMHKQVTIIPTETDAVVHAIKYAKKGSFITICSEKINDTINIIMKCKAEEDKYGIVVGSSIYKNEDPELLTDLTSSIV